MVTDGADTLYDQQYIVCVKIMIFFTMPKIIRY